MVENARCLFMPVTLLSLSTPDYATSSSWKTNGVPPIRSDSTLTPICCSASEAKVAKYPPSPYPVSVTVSTSWVHWMLAWEMYRLAAAKVMSPAWRYVNGCKKARSKSFDAPYPIYYSSLVVLLLHQLKQRKARK